MDRADEIRDDYYEHADEWHADRIERRRDRSDDRSDDRTPSGDVHGIGRANSPRDHVPSNDDTVE